MRRILVVAHPDVVAIALTGFDDPVLRSEAAQVGCPFLLTPIVPDDLLKLPL